MFNNFSKPATPIGNNIVTPAFESVKYESKRYEEYDSRGKTAPQSEHHSKERTPSHADIAEQMMLKQKILAHNKSNSLQTVNQAAAPTSPVQISKLTKQSSGIIPITNNMPIAAALQKRSESQKSRDSSQPHFLKRKD